jgi:hypothetical protein
MTTVDQTDPDGTGAEAEAQPEPRPRCAMCGHAMTLAMCGSASLHNRDLHVDLCHTASHDCYYRWTVHGERPITEDDERIEEIAGLVEAFDHVTPAEMTTFFYMHAYNELDLAVRDLLAIVKRLRP